MKQQYDKNLILDIIDAIENLGNDGFHWGKRDNEFLKRQKKLKQCLYWIDREYTLEAYIKASGLRASQLKRAIEASEDIDIPLGCIITAIAYNYHRFRYIKTTGWEDMIFFAPADLVRELKSKIRKKDNKISPERLQQIIEA